MDFCFYNDSCEVRLARTKDEIVKAQKLRYHVFYEIMSATPSEENALSKKDSDSFDEICDHLLVIDKTNPDEHRVVGNYRLLCTDSSKPSSYFYSSQEYDIDNMLNRAKQDCSHILELGRSCVHPNFRSNAIIQMLWRGIVAYAMEKKVGLMFGCASFSGIDLNIIQDDLASLSCHRLAPPEWRATARKELYVPMNPENKIVEDKMSLMPPLIKGYLRLGAWIGEGAVIDKQFSTTDILIILPVANISKRYIDFFGRG